MQDEEWARIVKGFEERLERKRAKEKEEKEKEKERLLSEHHCWCNGQTGPVKGCRWCDPDGTGQKGLWAKYPYETEDEMYSLQEKHFPNAVKR